MKRCKFIILISIFLLLVGTLSGCSISEYQQGFYDDNEKISKPYDSYSFKYRDGTTRGNKSEVEFKGFDGTNTIRTINSEEEGTIIIDFEARVQKGDFKGVLITPDKEVITIFEGSKSGSETFNIKKGKNRIKIVGRQAAGEVCMEVNSTSDIILSQAE